jgi:hypothetical protein
MLTFNVRGRESLFAFLIFANIQLDNLVLIFPGAALDEAFRVAVRASFR